MNRRLVLIIALMLLVGVLSVASNVQRAKASGTIYIRADGRIDPPTVPITTVDNATYTFIGDISDPIVVERDNILIDGAGYTVQGPASGKGIDLSSRKNVVIREVVVTSFKYGIYVSLSNGINTTDCTAIGNIDTGIYIRESRNNTLSGNTARLNDQGIELYYSSGNTLSSNNVTENNVGILLHSSSGNTLSTNNVTSNYGNGVGFFDSSNNTLSGSNVKNNDDGFELFASSNNTFAGNNVTANYGTGVWLYSCSGNLFYHNSFIANTQQVNSTSSGTSPPDVWDDGYPSGGNYWSNYTSADKKSGLYQNETGSDGMGDAAYAIDANNTDHYPLMGMFSDFKATLEQGVQIFSNSSISDFQSNGTSISFNVTGEDGTAGFCRICISTALINATYRVLVNGTEVPCNLLPCSNSTHNYLYFNYTHSTEEVVIIPEFPSFLILPSFFMAILLAVTVYRRRMEGADG